MGVAVHVFARLFTFYVFLNQSILLKFHPVVFDTGLQSSLIDVVVKNLVGPSKIDKTVNVLEG